MSWNPPADLAYADKILVLRDYAQRYGLRTMVETGLYGGRGSGMEMRDLIDRYEVIDSDLDQCLAASNAGAKVWYGDSASADRYRGATRIAQSA